MTTATVETEEVTTVKVGDYFYASWGYDQTNVDFYKVVGFTASGKSVRIQKVGAAQGEGWSAVVPTDQVAEVTEYVKVAGGWRESTGRRVPAPVETKLLQSYGEGANKRFYLAWASYANLHLWEGRPVYETPAGFGH